MFDYRGSLYPDERKVLRFPNMMNIGKCMSVSGDVFVRSQHLGDGPFVDGALLQVEDEILTKDGSFAHIEFLDGSKFLLSENSQFSVDAFQHIGDQNEDIAHFSVSNGKFICVSGDTAKGVDEFIVQINDTTLSLRSAIIAGRVDHSDGDLITLLPQKTGPAGEVLAHTKSAVETIGRAYQTLRFGGASNGLSAPLTLPSQVVIDTYMGPGLEQAFNDPELHDADLIDEFKPFDVFNDQFLERQFISTHVYPSDIRREADVSNELLEDAFVGERFRLKNRER